ncbi:MAG: DUF393 domain-containing protein [Myxococcaceae bacterium]|nr:DUF393 domain-containing protein [Myxococcaceae bacterium]
MSAATFLYDGHCRLCTASAHRVRKAARGALVLRSFRDDGVPESYGLKLADLERAVHLVRADGSVEVGVTTFATALKGRWYGPLLQRVRLPGVHAIASAAYAWVSKRRFRIAGRTCDGTCGLYG